MSFRDIYSNFGFLNALTPAASLTVGQAGETLDLLGYQGAVVAVNVGAIGFQSASALHLRLQHGLASDAGVSAWSNVPASLIIHSVAGGYTSTAETGVWQSFLSTEAGSTIYFVGYKGDNTHRYLRLYISGDAGLGSFTATAVAILGLPANWPVNEPAAGI